MANQLRSFRPIRILVGRSCNELPASLSSVSVRYHQPFARELSRSVQHAFRNCISYNYYPEEGSLLKNQEHTLPQPKNMTLEVMDDYLVKHEANTLIMQGTLRILLLLQAAQNDTKSVLSLIKRAKGDGMKPSSETMLHIVKAYIKNKNIDAALNMYSSIIEEYPCFFLDCGTLISLCTLLVENERGHVAIKTLREHVQLSIKGTISINKIRENCRNLLTAAATTCDYELTKQLFDVLLSGELVEPENFIVTPLLQCKLNSGDLPGAVKVAEFIYKTYNLLPKRMEILILILHYYRNTKRKITVTSNTCSGIEHFNTDIDLLEHMFHLIIQCHGSAQAQHDLMFSFLEAGLPDEAREVLQNLGKEVNANQLNKMCKVYSKMEQEDTLLHFLNVSRGNDSVDRQRIFSALLDMYNTQGAGEKAMSLWKLMQREGFSPSEAFISTLDSLLINNKIPFQNL